MSVNEQQSNYRRSLFEKLNSSLRVANIYHARTTSIDAWQVIETNKITTQLSRYYMAVSATVPVAAKLSIETGVVQVWGKCTYHGPW